VTRVFVGTLENGEAEFNACKNALAAQKNVEIHHHVISGQAEKIAHQNLVEMWMQHRSEFDFFLKLDADTVLIQENSICDMANLMNSMQATGMQVKLLDYFSQQSIAGLNMFTPEVSFHTRVSRLRPDNSDYGHKKVLRGIDVKHLEPIGYHGLYPNSRQAFFYGFHRFLKGQYSLLESVYEQWCAQKDDARKWALVGASEAKRKFWGKVFYSSQYVDRSFRRIGSNVSDEYVTEFAETCLLR
jgi:hypothetical protein